MFYALLSETKSFIIYLWNHIIPDVLKYYLIFSSLELLEQFWFAVVVVVVFAVAAAAVVVAAFILLCLILVVFRFFVAAGYC